MVRLKHFVAKCPTDRARGCLRRGRNGCRDDGVAALVATGRLTLPRNLRRPAPASRIPYWACFAAISFEHFISKMRHLLSIYSQCNQQCEVGEKKATSGIIMVIGAILLFFMYLH